jgi:hypothetical protein
VAIQSRSQSTLTLHTSTTAVARRQAGSTDSSSIPLLGIKLASLAKGVEVHSRIDVKHYDRHPNLSSRRGLQSGHPIGMGSNLSSYPDSPSDEDAHRITTAQ